MHDTTSGYLLQIHPKGIRSEQPTDDALTEKMAALLQGARKGLQYKGRHTCTGCGKLSDSCDLHVGPFITKSLAVHYLRWHRGDVPQSELVKLEQL